MKTIKKLLAIIMMVAGLFLNHNKSMAQCWANPYAFISPYTDELQTQQGTLAIMQGNNSNPTPGTATVAGVGINTLTPAYILDMQGNYIGDGVNVRGII